MADQFWLFVQEKGYLYSRRVSLLQSVFKLARVNSKSGQYIANRCSVVVSKTLLHLATAYVHFKLCVTISCVYVEIHKCHSSLLLHLNMYKYVKTVPGSKDNLHTLRTHAITGILTDLQACEHNRLCNVN